MPTTRPRHQVTETPEVASALDAAAAHWPDEPRSKLLTRLLEVGRVALETGRAGDVDAHRAAVLASSGRYANSFDGGCLEALRADWPA